MLRHTGIEPVGGRASDSERAYHTVGWLSLPSISC